MIVVIGIEHIKVEVSNYRIRGAKITFACKELFGILVPGQVFQAINFDRTRFGRDTLVVHSYDPSTGVFVCTQLMHDSGRVTDPSIKMAHSYSM